MSRKLTIHEMKISQVPDRRNDSIYSGKISFHLNHSGMNPGDTVMIESAGKECTFYIIRVYKTFGQDTKSVWQVFLGEIE